MHTKLLTALLAPAIAAALVSSAAASSTPPSAPLTDATFTLHENLHTGQKVYSSSTSDYKNKSTAVTSDQKEVTDMEAAQSWKATLTVQAEKNGSATQAQVFIDPDSYDTSKSAGQDAVKTPCTFAGKTVTLTRKPDESITNDTKTDTGDPDVNLMNSFIIPDEDAYPDKPVAVGDTWDNSDKVAKHALLGPRDQIKTVFRLDSVRVVHGKQIAHISASQAIIYHEEGNIEEDQQCSVTLDVDIAAGMIIKCDETGSSTFSTPPTEATQVTGGTEFNYHSEILPNPPDAQPATQP